MAALRSAIRERALQFGEDRRLLGMLSLPPGPGSNRPAIIIPNTGVDHRIGPNRLHVQLARALAGHGYPTLRFDLSGMGDSGLPGDARGDVLGDQCTVLDELQRLGVADRFIAVGLCSGAHDVHGLAKADSRVIAAAFIDHYTYPTLRFGINFVLQRLTDPRRWSNYVARKCAELTQNEKERFRGDQLIYLNQPERAAFDADLAGFIQRQLALFFFYTGEYQNIYNYREQLLDGFPRLRKYECYDLHYYPCSDHTFTQASMRIELIDALRRWLDHRVVPTLASPALKPTAADRHWPPVVQQAMS